MKKLSLCVLLLGGLAVESRAVMVHNCSYNQYQVVGYLGNADVNDYVALVVEPGQTLELRSVIYEGEGIPQVVGAGHALAGGVHPMGDFPGGGLIQDSAWGEYEVFIDANGNWWCEMEYSWLEWFWDGFWLGGSLSVILVAVSAVKAGLGVAIDYSSMSRRE